MILLITRDIHENVIYKMYADEKRRILNLNTWREVIEFVNTVSYSREFSLMLSKLESARIPLDEPLICN